MGGPRYGTPGMERRIEDDRLYFSCTSCDWSLFGVSTAKAKVGALVDVVVIHLDILHGITWPEAVQEATKRSSQVMLQEARTVR